jgi:serine/threonine protein kinase
MLTLQLFLGYEEFPGLDSVVFKRQHEIDTYLGFVFGAPRLHGLMSEPAKSFIYGCLAYDSARRPTACQAFSHDWLQEPKSDRKMFKRLEADNVSSWKPQRVKFPVIEDLTASTMGEGRGQPAASKDSVWPHFMVQEQAGTDSIRNAHSDGGMLAQGLVPSTGFGPGQVQAKRKRMVTDSERSKRLRSSN